MEKETSEFSGPYSEIWPAKLTNHIVRTEIYNNNNDEIIIHAFTNVDLQFNPQRMLVNLLYPGSLRPNLRFAFSRDFHSNQVVEMSLFQFGFSRKKRKNDESLSLSLRLEMDNKRRAKRAGDFLGN